MLKFFKKLISPFSKIKSLLGQKIRALFSNPLDESMFEELEKLFYEADLGASMAAALTDLVRRSATKNPDPDFLLSVVKNELMKVFIASPVITPTSFSRPHVILIVGVNGSGKTTSLAKLAHYFQSAGKSVLIGAGDTFRAAAIEQLETWGKRLGSIVVKSNPHADPSAIAFDAIASAKAKKIDIVLIDTAGRLQTKTALMQELAKIRRVCQKQIPDAPHETLLVLDAAIGQNALDAARVFHEFTPITGIVLAKLDGSAKGGVAVAIQKELNLPIQWVGLGENMDDLAPFDPENYINALLG
ncbi:MAG TPA: signal recognition particle-docking protein FtsY, partial [Chlamydiales bacterium]|nr:signal recognition particle-docking protein FtsY [Chlamydiales bacterium]